MNREITDSLRKIQRDRDKLCLKQLYQSVGDDYFKGLQVDERIPYRLKADFLDAGHVFFGRLADELSDCVDEKASDARYSEIVTMKRMLKSASDVVTEHTQQLPTIIRRYDKEFRGYIALQQENAGRYLFVSEQGEDTCDSCYKLHGRTFSLRDLAVPPMHPNCRCSVVALDNVSEIMYDLNRFGFMSAVETVLRNDPGGVWRMENADADSNVRIGVVPFQLSPISLSDEPAITDGTDELPVIDGVINWAKDFGEDAAAFLQQFFDSARQRADHRFDDFWSFWDWVTIGIISGIYNSARARADLMLSDPSLYNILNWLMLGLPDLIGRAFNPEKPLSFDHWVANMELISMLFGVYRGYQHHISAMAAPVLADPGMPHVSPDYDEVIGERPTWKQSEIDIGKRYPDYEAQKSFKNGKEVSYGTKGSVRPDFYKEGHSVEVKNYDISTAANRRNLIRTATEQYKQRLANLPEGTQQSLIIDIRGQRVTYTTLRSIKEQIAALTDSGLHVDYWR